MAKSWSISTGVVVIIVICLIRNISASLAPIFLVISHWNDIHGGFHALPGLVGGLHAIEEKLTFRQNHIRLSPGNFLGPENGILSLVSFLKDEKMKSDYFDMVRKLREDCLVPTAMSATPSDFRFGVDLAVSILGGPFHREQGRPQLLLANVVHPRPFNPQQWETSAVLHPLRDGDRKEIFVGIMGILLPSPSGKYPRPNTLVMRDDIISVLMSAIDSAKRETTSHIPLFIVVGDADAELCNAIMDAVPEVGVIISGKELGFGRVGGHIIHKNGGIIASAGVGGETLGRVQLVLQRSGHISEIHVSLLPQNNFTLDVTTEQILHNLTNRIATSSASQIIGRVAFPLEGESCAKSDDDDGLSLSHCLFGNIVADSLSRCLNRGDIFSEIPAMRNHAHKPIIAFWHRDGFASEEINIEAFADIRELDIHRFLPYLDSAQLWRIQGKDVKQLFTTHYTRLYVSDQLRVLFREGQVVNIFHSDILSGAVLNDDEELIVLLPSFLVDNTSTWVSLSIHERIHVVPCVLKLFEESGRLISSGAGGRVAKLRVEDGLLVVSSSSPSSENRWGWWSLWLGWVMGVMNSGLLIFALWWKFRHQRRRWMRNNGGSGGRGGGGRRRNRGDEGEEVGFLN